MAETIRLEPPLYCAFCGKDRRLVSKLVQSNLGVCICDECIDVAYELVHGNQKEKHDEQEDQMSEKLKPCPFCGSNDLYIVEHMIGRDAPFMSVDDKTVGIFCNTCKQTVILEANEDEGRDFITEQRAVEAWNRRAE